MMSQFNQAAYWIKRHEELRGDPRSVGNLAAAPELALGAEQNFQDLIGGLAHFLRPTVRGSILDLGCGYGRVAKPWIDEGFAYTGVDISPLALADARSREPRGDYFCANLLDWRPPKQAFGVVTLFFVLVHLVNDAEWAKVLDQALSAVSRQGLLVIADVFPTERQTKVAHATERPLAEYVPLLKSRSFVFDDNMRRSFLANLGPDGAMGRHFYFARRRGVAPAILPR